MMTAARSGSQRICSFRQYTPAWAIGTGLRVSLAPGKYRVTHEEVRSGVRYLCLDDAYRVDSREIGE